MFKIKREISLVSLARLEIKMFMRWEKINFVNSPISHISIEKHKPGNTQMEPIFVLKYCLKQNYNPIEFGRSHSWRPLNMKRFSINKSNPHLSFISIYYSHLHTYFYFKKPIIMKYKVTRKAKIWPAVHGV